MARSRRDLLEVLKLELEFLHNGGYRQFSWGPSLIFEDSPTCLNYGYSEYSRPCSVCALMQLVPVERRRGRARAGIFLSMNRTKPSNRCICPGLPRTLRLR